VNRKAYRDNESRMVFGPGIIGLGRPPNRFCLKFTPLPSYASNLSARSYTLNDPHLTLNNVRAAVEDIHRHILPYLHEGQFSADLRAAMITVIFEFLG